MRSEDGHRRAERAATTGTGYEVDTMTTDAMQPWGAPARAGARYRCAILDAARNVLARHHLRVTGGGRPFGRERAADPGPVGPAAAAPPGTGPRPRGPAAS